jgi:glutathionylspermidine synthase
MQRIAITPRQRWQELVEKQGFLFHTLNDVPYWDESACYKFSEKEILMLESTTQQLHTMCIEAAQYVIDNNLFSLFGIPEAVVPLVRHAWDKSDTDFWSLYGRFDLAYDGINPPKMLEFNADTPTSLFEASIVQWFWLKDYKPLADQFNSIDERLRDAWKFIHDKYRSSVYHFACLKEARGNISQLQLREDITNTAYILDTASSVKGLQYYFTDISNIIWNGAAFVDEHQKPVETLFKLYPWEWMVNEVDTASLGKSTVHWIEPIWKMLWSNKALLPILWKLYPNHPNLLPAYFEPHSTSYVKKPKLSREGANIEIVQNSKVILSTGGDYGEAGFIYQDIASIPNMDGNYPVIGSWIIGGDAAGMGIRESNSMITDNVSRFVPHYFE